MDEIEPPDLQKWIERYGGYWNIPFAEWDKANDEYQARRRQQLEEDWSKVQYKRIKI
jgi:hypothetical protein